MKSIIQKVINITTHYQKQIIKLFLVTTMFFLLFKHNVTRISTLNGMKLWLNTIVPVLFLITNMIIKYNAFTVLTRIVYPILCPILRISKNACFCVLCGFLCGFPLGIKVINDMLNAGKISASEANYLSIFCNNISPAFYINFIII